MAHSIQLEVASIVPKIHSMQSGTAHTKSTQFSTQGISERDEPGRDTAANEQSGMATESSWKVELKSQMSVLTPGLTPLESKPSAVAGTPNRTLNTVVTGTKITVFNANQSAALSVPAHGHASIPAATGSQKPVVTPLRVPLAGPVHLSKPEPVGPAPVPGHGPIQLPVSFPVTSWPVIGAGGGPVKGPVAGPVHSSKPEPVGPAPAPVQAQIPLPVSSPGADSESSPVNGQILGPYPVQIEVLDSGIHSIHLPRAASNDPLQSSAARGSEAGTRPILTVAEALLPSSPLILKNTQQTSEAQLTSASNSTGSSETLPNANHQSTSKAESDSSEPLSVAPRLISDIHRPAIPSIHIPAMNSTADSSAFTAPSDETGILSKSSQTGVHSEISTNETVPLPGSSSANRDELKNDPSEFAALSQAIAQKHQDQQGTNATLISGLKNTSPEPMQIQSPVNSNMVRSTVAQSTVAQDTVVSRQLPESAGIASESSVSPGEAVISSRMIEVQKTTATGQSKAAENVSKISAKTSGPTIGVEQRSNATQPVTTSTNLASGQTQSQSQAQAQTPPAQAQSLNQTAQSDGIHAATTATSVSGASPSTPLVPAQAGSAPRITGTAFDGIDSGATTESAGWVHATSHQVEAGVHDPNLGWIEVRANEGTGGVHATLIPATQSAANSLGQNLTGITNYLSAHETPVAALNVSNASLQGGASSFGQGLGDNPGQGAGSGQDGNQNPIHVQEQQDRSGDGAKQEYTPTEKAGSDLPGAFEMNGVTGGSFGGLSNGANQIGNRISVMA